MDDDTVALLHLVDLGADVEGVAERAIIAWGWDTNRAAHASAPLPQYIDPSYSTLNAAGEGAVREAPMARFTLDWDGALRARTSLPGEGISGSHRPIMDMASRRRILKEVVYKSEKYSRPFTRGQLASFSVIGTQDWEDYASLVVDVVRANTLLSIEESWTR